MALTPEEKERRARARQEKNRKARERYAILKNAGFKRDQIRNLSKTIEKQPEIIQDASDEVFSIVGRLRGLADDIADFLDVKDKPKTRRGRKPDTFEDFVRRYPDKSARQLQDEWRGKGKRIGRTKANEIVRRVRGQDFDPIKQTRFTHKSPREIMKDWGKRYHIPDRYVYLVGFQVEVEGYDEPLDDYIHLKSDTPITDMRELRDTVEQAWADGEEHEGKYKHVGIIRESIYLIYAVDQEKK